VELNREENGGEREREREREREIQNDLTATVAWIVFSKTNIEV